MTGFSIHTDIPLKRDFTASSAPQKKKGKKKRIPPVSVRFSKEERIQLEKQAAGMALTGQPRAIVFHEKENRRHCHAVWSRIKADEMKAVQLSYSHNKLQALSREIYLEHGWKMPRGLVNSQEHDPRNFTLAEWQQARRIGKDAREIKTQFQDAWAISDSKYKAYVVAVGSGDKASNDVTVTPFLIA